MSAAILLSELEQLDVRLSVDEGQLRFSAPKGALDNVLMQRLRDNKADIITILEQRNLEKSWDEQPIPILDRNQGAPLSFSQQRFWFLDQLDQGNSATFVMPPIVLRFEGNLNIDALENSLNDVVQRHEVLRSAFRIEDDQPVQIVLPDAQLSLKINDINGLNNAEKEEEINQHIKEQALMPFDLQQGEILMRALLLKLANDEHVFMLTMHHIIGDGWSMGILIEELSTLYRTYTHAYQTNTKIEHQLTPLPIQYADFSAWERKRMTDSRLENHRNYWLKQLSDAPSFLPLQTDRPRPKIRSNQGSAVYFELGNQCANQLSKICTMAGVTPFMALLSAFSVLLSRYTGEKDIVIGSPIAVRPHSQTESLIGLFLNTLALRIDLSAEPSFNELLTRVRKVSLESYEHKEIPFDHVLQALDLDRNPSYTPLFQVLFALQNAPMSDVGLDGLNISSQPTQSLHSPFDLVLSLEESTDNIQGFFRYNTDLFEHATIERMVEHFKILLNGLLTQPTENIQHLPIISNEERIQLNDWRGGKDQPTNKLTLAQTFNIQADQYANSIAARFNDQTLTYRQLNEKANQLAHRLHKIGVSRGDYVGLYTERSLELVIGVLGILKAGAAYIPLDPAYPDDRLNYMAQDSKLQVIVTYHESKPNLAVNTVNLDDPTLKAESIETPNITTSLDDIAYVIYTSGSTGKPKGVEVSNANVTRLFTTTEPLFGFNSKEVWCLFHSYAFDFSVWELWGALLHGGKIVVVPLHISRTPDQFHQFLQQNGVTVLNQTPSAFKQLIEADQRLVTTNQNPLDLKWVIFGGEALDPRHLANWVERYGLNTPQLINMYGITETTVHVSFHCLTQQDIEKGISTIGKPLPDLNIQIVDQHNQIVPIGIAGEMLIGGGGVAKGYLNLPKLTAERFVPDQNHMGSSQRLYRSGDLARWRSNGNLEYLGRIDHQVKIRGFRIELGEIERCLSLHDVVSEAVVLTTDEINGARLIAYAVTHDNQNSALTTTLRLHLQSLLPDYMIPATILLLDQLPLTNNGKLDRKQLERLLDKTRNEQANHNKLLLTPPETDLEKTLAALWCDVLSIPQINLDDNFFELGGDSIRGAILANKIQQKIESVVYVVALFEAPTIRLLITYLHQHYPEAMKKMGEISVAEQSSPLIDEQSVAAFKALIPPTPKSPSLQNITAKRKKNPRAIFVLSPPRSGSTLLRVLLGGHDNLFSPPELELLGFETLGERKQICSGRDAFWLEGTLRAVMEACNVDADQAKEIMASRENVDMPTQAFYAELQEWVGDKVLVDKSPSYALQKGVMERAEAYFDEPLYIHLHRHPYGMINSFEDAKLDQIFFRYPHQLTEQRLGELIWLQSHRNIFDFLSTIPAERQINVSFEDMTKQPETVVKQLCKFIDLDFSSDMLDLYNNQQKARMTDGIHQESTMLGDVKFHTHKQIDAAISERWRKKYNKAFLGQPTLDMAKIFGYNTDLETDNLPIKPLDRQDNTLPLSFAQQRLWFLDQLEGAGSAYNMPVALNIEGLLNTEAMTASLRAIVARHETLRSQFETIEGQPVVRVNNELPDTEIIDLSHLAVVDQQKLASNYIKSDAQTVFKLSSGPLFTSKLLKLSPTKHIVLVNMHHIVSDGWSMGVIVSEWGQLYNAYITKNASPLPPLSVQYGDYANWQQTNLANGNLTNQLAYWGKQLNNLPALLELPTDKPRPAIQQFRGGTFNLKLDSQLSIQLKRYAEQSGVSLYMLLLAGFGILLMRYSGQNDIAIGSPSANRSRTELEPLVGFFVNTMVMRLDLAPHQTFETFLKQVRQISLEAYANQDVSFEQLVEELKPQRNLSYSPLFQVMFSMQNTPSIAPNLTGLNVSEITNDQIVSKYDLTLAISEIDNQLEANIEYNSDLFECATISRFAKNYTQLLGSLLQTPNSTIDKLNILNSDDVYDLITAKNKTDKDIDSALTIHQLFENQAIKTPNAIAVTFQKLSLTYEQLNQEAQNLSQELQQLGLSSGCLVGICVPRSLDMLIGLLAVLKAGASYVPLDPNYPADRIEDVLIDADVSLLITTQGLYEKFAHLTCPLFLTDNQNTNNIIIKAKQNNSNLAYVIYTSGSTGKPKGVMINHAAAVNFLTSMVVTPGIKASDTLLAVTTIAFDIAVLELYMPLIVGAKVIIADEEMTRDGQLLMKTINTEQVSIMQATPATWRLLLASDWQGSPHLNVLCGGEALPSSLAKKLLPRVNSLWNLYGPTEATVWSTIHSVSEKDLNSATIPIGKPINNTKIYILDDNLALVPVGVRGEMYIGGLGLACAYLNRPELTQLSFINDPFVPGQRMYKTGDLARNLSNDSIEYMGRNDQQIKIRGFRVEPGEVEHVLTNQTGVDICTVIVDRANTEHARLVAYYLGNESDKNKLKQALQRVLPDYMVPSLILQLSEMPLTNNGKVDRRALSQLKIEQSTSTSYIGARDSIEVSLVRIWEEVLGIKSIGIRDDFFDLGGHSIIAVRLMAQVSQQFDRKLPLASLFQGSTIESLAQLLRTDNDENVWSSVVPIQTKSKGTPFFCAAGAGGNIVYFNELARAMSDTHPFIGLQPLGLDGVTAPFITVDDLAKHYLNEIKEQQKETPKVISGHSFGGLVAYEMALQLEKQGNPPPALILIDTPAPHFFKPTGDNWSQSQWLTQVSEIISHLYNVNAVIPTKDFELHDQDGQLNLLHTKLIATGVLPEQNDVSFLRGFIEVYKANLCVEYDPAKLTNNTEILLLRSQEQQPEYLTTEQFSTTRSSHCLGWERYFDNPITVKDVPGDHLTMMRSPNANVLSKEIIDFIKNCKK
ncbi:non-ribosomal peptide synthetase [Algibacillus agarilyticus]|uniref:non-ribosomal peptide synthetase n=1 Tax=Algibacillus agarilyticus TaxID=2234133 RepID=UPI000DD0B704|nr:non-ribosomal peptide synthetase [Algibacillus agarilyticus]